eukprot:Sspe_Gene.95256::Locus_67555_Transcript_1_1_Confidence_1.000_Length_821::g.95256::m.95256/K13348/MPV17; protein Mpv17
MVLESAVLVGCLGNGVLLTVSDYSAQLIERSYAKQQLEAEGREPVLPQYDYLRTLRFAGIGVFLTGPLTFTRYAILGSLFGTATTAEVAIEKMLFNQLCFDPPETAIHLAGLEWWRTKGDMEAVKEKVRSDYWNVQFPSWAVAFPVNVCTFMGFSSVWKQMLFQRTVSTCFNVYFSYIANRKVGSKPDPVDDDSSSDTSPGPSDATPRSSMRRIRLRRRNPNERQKMYTGAPETPSRKSSLPSRRFVWRVQRP